MTNATVYAELMHGYFARVQLRRSEPNDAGQIAVHASAEIPKPLRQVAAEHGLPAVYELSTSVAIDDPTSEWAVDLLVCDVVADMRRDLHRALGGGRP
jgi:hypothetical protein